MGIGRGWIALLLGALLLSGTAGAIRAQTPPATGTGMIAVVTDPEGLNLRAGPGTEFPTLVALPKGTELIVLGEQVNGVWLPVAYQEKRGFVHSDYVELRPAGGSATPGPGGTASPTATPAQPGTSSATPTPAQPGTGSATATASPISGATGTPGAFPTPPPGAAATPPAGATATPATPTPTPTPTPPRTGPLAPPPAPLTNNGITLLSVTATDSDEMITVADEFSLTATIRVPEGVERMVLRLRGAPFITYTGTFPVQAGDNALLVSNFRVDTELEPALREGVLRKVGDIIPIRDGALELSLTYTDRDGNEQTATFSPPVVDELYPAYLAKIEYPDLKRITGLPPEGTGQQNYYLRGNVDFHHPDNYYVRKLAVEAGRNGGVFPDDPEVVADNVFKYINALLGDADPGDFNNDANIAQLLDEGTIKRGQVNGGYICIGQTYFMTALTRTLGLPSRELNLAIGRAGYQGNDGYWRVEWWQEAAVHTWYKGQWHHYDLWLGFKGLDQYFQLNLAYQAWAAFGPQTTPFITTSGVATGLRGHNFNQWPGDPPHFEFIGEATRPGVRVFGMPDPEEPSTLDDGRAKRLPDGQPPAPRRPALQIATPPAMQIRLPGAAAP